MLLVIPQILDPSCLQQIQHQLQHADWIDGRATAGYQGSRVKHNQQLAEHSALAQSLGDQIVARLETNPLFISAALPAQIYPPLFNRYETGMTFGNHIDNSIRLLPNSGQKLRTDLSATLFLSEPSDYQGGELVIEDTYGTHDIKLSAGDLLLYPANSLHRVNPVSSGQRLACFFWLQSLIRDQQQRRILFELDQSIQRLHATQADQQALLQLTGNYHNLLRLWAEL